MARKPYIDEHGEEWDSRFESEVYDWLDYLGYDLRRCEPKRDSLAYTTPVKQGVCLECGSHRVGQSRTYTPDILLYGYRGMAYDSPIYVEVKGYWPANKRWLLRSFIKERDELGFIFIFQQDLLLRKGSKSRYSDYMRKYFKNTAFTFYPDPDPLRFFTFSGDEKKWIWNPK